MIKIFKYEMKILENILSTQI